MVSMERTKQDKNSHCFNDFFRFLVARFFPVYFIVIQPGYFYLRIFIEYNSFDIFDIVLFLYPVVEELTDRKANILPVLVRRLSAEYCAAHS